MFLNRFKSLVVGYVFETKLSEIDNFSFDQADFFEKRKIPKDSDIESIKVFSKLNWQVELQEDSSNNGAKLSLVVVVPEQTLKVQVIYYVGSDTAKDETADLLEDIDLKNISVELDCSELPLTRDNKMSLNIALEEIYWQEKSTIAKFSAY